MRAAWLGLFVVAGCGRIDFDPTSALALSLSPPSARVNINSLIAFEASGGTPPYSFTTTLGAIDDTGQLRAPGRPGVAAVAVTDANSAMASAEVTIGGDYLYAVGGYDGVAGRDEVWRTSDGVTWTVVGHLPATRDFGSLIVYDDQLFYAGGTPGDPNGAGTGTVYRSSDGASWTDIGTLPRMATAQGSTVFNGRMLLGSGILDTGAAAYTTVLWSSSDGITWHDEPPLPVATHSPMLVPYDGRLWSVAGHEATMQSNQLHVSPDGATWTSPGVVPAAGEYLGVCEYEGRLWAAGGLGLNDRVVSTTDGATWVDAKRLPVGRTYNELVWFAGQLWVVAGMPTTTLRTTDGLAWEALTAFPMALEGTRVVQFTPR